MTARFAAQWLALALLLPAVLLASAAEAVADVPPESMSLGDYAESLEAPLVAFDEDDPILGTRHTTGGEMLSLEEQLYLDRIDRGRRWARIGRITWSVATPIAAISGIYTIGCLFGSDSCGAAASLFLVSVAGMAFGSGAAAGGAVRAASSAGELGLDVPTGWGWVSVSALTTAYVLPFIGETGALFSLPLQLFSVVASAVQTAQVRRVMLTSRYGLAADAAGPRFAAAPLLSHELRGVALGFHY